MNTSEVLELLRLYRHDLMNDLQLIQGYAGMGKYEQSNEKLKAFINKLNQERQLQTLEAPNFVLWLILLKLHQRELHTTLEIEPASEPISQFDRQMKADGEYVLNILKNQSEKLLMSFSLTIKINYEQGWNIKYSINHNFDDLFNELQSLKHFYELINHDDQCEIVFKYK
ncbi:Spo0B domain-containing protein [Bacillaceae bacterium W0354]